MAGSPGHPSASNLGSTHTNLLARPRVSGVITVLSGGVGAARLLRALRAHDPHVALSAVVNVGDDLVMHGLSICPDLDTIMYTLAGINNDELGWGLVDETWRVMGRLGELGGENWFALGDLDLATHLYRSQRLAAGATKTVVSGELARRLGLDVALLPVSDDVIATEFDTEKGPMSFQEYFVRHHHDVVVRAVRVRGAASARLSEESREALERSERIVIAPSNPLISIDPILRVPGVVDILRRRRDDVVAVSPLVAGAALKGPADRLMRELGHEVSAVGVARFYQGVVGTMVIDERDAHDAGAVAATGCAVRVTTTVMSDEAHAMALAREVRA
ncbi:MAG: 2-phospho-L-lactate transferase [Acidobacteriota bacterium]|nr:2-phospho-L-lactate transferase [Acidobacteriota bacterium]